MTKGQNALGPAKDVETVWLIKLTLIPVRRYEEKHDALPFPHRPPMNFDVAVKNSSQHLGRHSKSEGLLESIGQHLAVFDEFLSLLLIFIQREQSGGKDLWEGQSVMFLFVSANRDEREFDEPNRFDILRRPKRILTFGHGNHACLGIHIAALEGTLSLAAVLDRMPDYRIDRDRIRRLRSEFVAGITGLPATWTPT